MLTLANGENLLGSWQVFRSDFVKKIEAARQRDASNYDIKVGSKVLAALQEKIGKYVLMRKRKDHLGDIVPQNHE